MQQPCAVGAVPSTRLLLARKEGSSHRAASHPEVLLAPAAQRPQGAEALESGCRRQLAPGERQGGSLSAGSQSPLGIPGKWHLAGKTLALLPGPGENLEVWS